MAFPVTNLRKGTVFSEEGIPFLVLKYTHTKVGRGNATIRVKVRNLKTGDVLEKTFLSGKEVEEGELERKRVQYLYDDPRHVVFMDPESFDQVAVEKEIIGEDKFYIKEGDFVTLLYFEEKPLSLELPSSIELTVRETGSSEKGDSAGSVTKEAVLETGLRVQVPMFVKIGDRVKINTETGEYMERVQ